MNSIRKFARYIIPFVFIYICCLGVGYAGWADHDVLQASLNTGQMDYSLKSDSINIKFNPKEKTNPVVSAEIIDSGKKLQINIENAIDFMNYMQRGNSVTVQYSLDDSSKDNLTLKPIDKKMGIYHFELDKNSIECKFNNTVINKSAVLSLFPTTLGTFHVQHKFDGKNGQFELKSKKYKDKYSMDSNMDWNRLSADLQTEIKSCANHPNPGSNTAVLGDLSIKADYSLTLDLCFDQYNTK